MRLMIASLVLNEMEWLPKLYQQHKDFPNLVEWVFVESADVVYAETNPGLVDCHGLSVDGTSEFLTELSSSDSRITYLPHGFCKNPDRAQGKIEARNRYLEQAERIKPDYILILDGDEFWPMIFQAQLEEWFTENPRYQSFSFPHREIWHPPSIQHASLFHKEVIGGFWNILYCRAWKWSPGLRYIENHNTPSHAGCLLTANLKDHRLTSHTKSSSSSSVEIPYYVHMAFASNPDMRIAKNKYYENRGEKVDPRRKWYTESRQQFELWKPNRKLPKGAQVVNYDGLIPECFL